MPRFALLVGLLAAGCSFDTRGISSPARPDRALPRDGLPRAERRPDLAGDAGRADLAPHPEQALPCTPQSCAGCCAGQVCQPGNATGLCGKGGESCIDCKVTAMICSAGVCTAPCASSSHCGGADVCVPPDCVPPYGRDYTVAILSAKVFAGFWDMGPDPDPFCAARRNGVEVHRTKVAPDTLAPAWSGESFVVQLDKGVTLEIECWDDDDNMDDWIGKVVWAPEVPASVLKAGTATTPGTGSLSQLVVSFTPK